ncbi:MAG: phosphohistidine phosphatase [Burkholderiaceae bacterium]|nr:phosphohistidine phosphatase [Burkholderiaceae bacterium]
MELILWRHAEAFQGTPDLTRALNGKGRKQASKIADWLDANLPDSCRILVSPATRCVQTAEALGRKFRIHPELATDSTPEKILQAANWPNSREPVLIVGHQPTLGQVAALLISGSAQDWRIRRGNVWWISQRERDGEVSNYLRAAMTPELLPTVRK